MRNLKITVNGVSYDVQVEDVAGGAVSAPAAAPAPKAAAPAPAPKAAAPAAAPSAGSVQVTIPMPGTIVSVNVSAGQSVKKGDVLVVFEAMKMENEIQCPQDGKVASVLCAKGENKESGAVLLTLE